MATFRGSTAGPFIVWQQLEEPGVPWHPVTCETLSDAEEELELCGGILTMLLTPIWTPACEVPDNG